MTTAVVADIGGTNTRVALSDGPTIRPDTIRRFRNRDHGGIIEVLDAYLSEAGTTVDAACVAMAGPVKDGVGTLTNLDWLVDRTQIATATGARTVAVLNDLQAQGHSLNHVGDTDLIPVRQGISGGANAARLVLNVGTGLNAALVYRTDAQTLVPPSESGHITLPARTAEELELAAFLARAHGFPGAEEALSGRGIENLYAFACHKQGRLIPDMTGADIMAACARGDDPCATHAVQMFVRLMGRWASDLALIQLPFGGIYLFGGVVRAFQPYLAPMGFESAFLDKGRFSGFLNNFPIYLVTDDYAPLRGSASHLMELLART